MAELNPSTLTRQEYVLEVEDLWKSYGVVQALQGFSMAVPRGAFYGFFGRNGAGKTTTLDIATGLLGRDRGRLRLFGEEVGLEPSPELKERFAYVGGNLNLYDWLTLEEHLEFISGFYPTWDAARCEELKGLFRLPLTQRAGSLSPGQHIQFQLLMALSRHPELLIIDEPGNLDPVVRRRLMQTMVELLDQRRSTVLMASHLIDELEGYCDHMCVIEGGVALAAGSIEALTAEVREVRFPGAAATGELRLAGVLVTQAGGGEVRVVMPHFTEGRAAALAQELGAGDYEVAQVGLEDFFVALMTERESA
jgi:ABC-2 type transport system ATP-binding protein